MHRWNKLIPLIIVFNFLSAQSISTIDTIQVKVGQKSIELNPFIIDSSLYVFHNGKLIDDYLLDAISGDLELTKPAQKDGIYHISYKYLAKILPIQVGPLYRKLPSLDSLLMDDKNVISDDIIQQQLPNSDISNLATTGTIYRNLSLSPLGGSDFSGGLQLQLQGQLSKDITVSGVLSDQSIPIQPEGTTQALEEIDKVYLHVQHPVFQIMAGDIEYSLNNGKYLNVRRKLEGLKGELKVDKWTAQGALASSKGRYNKLSFKGTDGIQGPYALTSETGSKDIIVLAGTEKVYLNGEQIKRGENFDYTIDYSTGEITFTPRRLIDFDTDIYVEYEYSDYQYTRNVISSSIIKELGDWGQIGLSWMKEKDNLQIEDNLSRGLRDSLKSAGDNDAVISGVIEDEEGNYIFENGIYIYSPDLKDNTKYKVSFQNDNVNGKYSRRVSASGEIYFEYVEEENRTQFIDLYSPFTKWSTPINHEILQVIGDIKLSKNANANWDLSLSNFDKNTYSNINDDDNLGFAYNIDIKGDSIPIFKNILLGYKLTNWDRAKTFNEISKDRDVLFNIDWNFEPEEQGRESLFLGGINLISNELLKTSVDWSRYKIINNTRERFTVKLNSSSKYLPQFSSYLNQVKNQRSNFYQYNIDAQLLPGNFHPIFSYDGEFEKENHKFDVTKIGFLYSNKKHNISASITQRNDYEPSENDSTEFNLIQDGVFSEVDINGKIKNSWSGKIVFKKRLSDNLKTKETLDYAIGIANLRFNNKTSPIRWDFLSKLEETYTESRAVVYDSVGTGLGSYRFDKEFNEYIADPNGAYISYTVLTGDRNLNTHFSASQRFFIDFGKSKMKLLKFFDFRSDLKTEYRGKSLSADKVFSPNIQDDNIANSKYNFRNEVDYNPTGSNRRIRNWSIISKNLLGTDPRGNDLRTQTEYGIEWREPIKEITNSVLNVEYHTFDNSSNFSDLRNRNVEGWWIEEELKLKIDRKWQFSVSALGGSDTGLHNKESFEAYAYGIKFEGQRFIKSTTSIKVRTELFNSKSLKENATVPPEALNGLPIGQSISINLQGQILLGKNLSLNTTASYIDNSRYNNFFTISGELRAYF